MVQYEAGKDSACKVIEASRKATTIQTDWRTTLADSSVTAVERGAKAELDLCVLREGVDIGMFSNV